mmetsp:Transcript_24906/g.61604  ORF Transcript_24906/g.61604 Transcript_24906/m.61604 type:complete len:480 (+) Transcript_24906:3-1442(+)
MNGKECTKPNYANMLTYCDKGYTMHKGKCIKYETTRETAPAEYYCPKGYTDAGDNCARTSSAHAHAYCPKGYTLQGKDTCESYKTAEPEKYCSKGTETKEGCGKHDTVPKTSSCPKGYTEGKKGCERCYTSKKHTHCDYTKMVHSCPKGYTMNGKECTRFTPHPYEYKCPKGYTEGSGKHKKMTCYTKETKPASHKCPKGYDGEGKECTKTDYVKKHGKCPKGYDESHGKDKSLECYKHVTVTVEGPVHNKCPKGYDEADKKCVNYSTIKATGKCPKGYDAGKSKECTKYVTTPAETPMQYKCPKGYDDMDGKTCSRVVPTKALSKCPKGYTMNGKSCDKPVSTRVTVPPQHRCVKGYDLNGKECTKTVTAPKHSKCPKGYSKGKECVSYKSAPMEPHCPKGEYTLSESKTSSYGGRRKHRGSKHHKSSHICELTKTAAPHYYCPKGYELVDGKCLGHETTTPTKTYTKKGYSSYYGHH